MVIKYAPHTQTDAYNRARGWIGKKYAIGMCQYFQVIEIFGTMGVGDYDRDGSPDAEDGWKAAVANGVVVPASKIERYSDIPLGYQLFWGGGSRDHGHTATSAPGGMAIGTDRPYTGRIGMVHIEDINRAWRLPFLGYATTEGHGLRLTDKPGTKPPKMNKMDPSSYFIGAIGDHVTWLGERLVAHGFGQFYKKGPGPVFSEVDRKAVQACQRAQGFSGADADGFPGKTTLAFLASAPKPPTSPKAR